MIRRLVRVASRLLATVRHDATDAIAALGVVLLTIGGWTAWEPLLWIVPGVSCLALGLLGARANAKGRRLANNESGW